MIAFWLIAVPMVLGAAAFVVWPLMRGRMRGGPSRHATAVALYRSKLEELEADLAAGLIAAEQHAQACAELEQALLDETVEAKAIPPLATGSKRGAVALALLLPATALGLYLALGQPDALTRPAHPAVARAATPAPIMDQDEGAGPLEILAVRLAQRLEQTPDDPSGWTLLGQTYDYLRRYAEAEQAYARALALAPTDAKLQAAHAEARQRSGAGMTTAPAVESEDTASAEEWIKRGRGHQRQRRFAEAAAAYARATELDPGNAPLWADRADASAAANGRNLVGAPEEMITSALRLDPNEPKALWLAGTVALQKGDKAAAQTHWQRLYGLLAPTDPWREAIAANLEELTKPTSMATPAPTAARAPVAQAKSIRGTVSLAPSLAAQVAPTDTVFIFARAANGPRMPLAALRKQAGELPLEFELDDSLAMTPEMSLSRFEQVVVGARISRAGSAMPQSGDLEGLTGTLTVGAGTPARIVIDKTIP